MYSIDTLGVLISGLPLAVVTFSVCNSDTYIQFMMHVYSVIVVLGFINISFYKSSRAK